jgi:hypothetical protein
MRTIRNVWNAMKSRWQRLLGFLIGAVYMSAVAFILAFYFTPGSIIGIIIGIIIAVAWISAAVRAFYGQYKTDTKLGNFSQKLSYYDIAGGILALPLDILLAAIEGFSALQIHTWAMFRREAVEQQKGKAK